MGDTSEAQALTTEPASTNTTNTQPGVATDNATDSVNSITEATNSRPEDCSTDKNVDVKTPCADNASSTADTTTTKEGDLPFGKPNDDDQAANAALSDQDQKFTSKLLESEAEQRNTSTSNAGESEYESANEEDIADFENTPPEPDSVTAAPATTTASAESADKTITASSHESEKSEPNATDNNSVEASKEGNFDNVQNSSSSAVNHDVDGEGVSQNEDETNNSNDLSEEVPVEKVLSRIRRRKKRSKLSDEDETLEDDDEFEEVSGDDEVATEDIDDEEDSFDEAEEGQLADEAADASVNVVEDERENGDGQESENQDSKAKGGKVPKKGEIEDKRNPQYIPRKGPFYEHDDRINEADKPKESPESTKVAEGEEGTEAEKTKPKSKRLMASMKLRSDEMADDEAEADQLSSKSASKEKLQDSVSSSPSVETLGEKTSTSSIKSLDSKSPRGETSLRTKKPLWDSKDRWSHDKFNVDDQKPKTREELIIAYGYDIRTETDAPKLQRRSKYGKAPQKYSRRPEDDAGSSFAKRTLRKAILRSPHEARADEVRQETLREKEMQREDEEIAYSQPLVAKKDQVFNNRHTPKDRKFGAPNSNHREPQASSASGSNRSNHSNSSISSKSNSISNNYADSSRDRLHENRVFVNKSGQSSKFMKNEKPRIVSQQEQYRDTRQQLQQEYGPSKAGEPSHDFRRGDVRESEPRERSKELFTNDDFPELVSAPSKAGATVESANKPAKSVIYYTAQPTANSNKGVDSNSKYAKDTHQHGSNNVPIEFLKETNWNDIDAAPAVPLKPSTTNQSVPVLKSQMFENSRLTRSRNNYPSNEYSNRDRDRERERDRDRDSSWNNNNANSRSMGPSKSSSYGGTQQHQQQAPMKKQPMIISATNKEEAAMANDTNEASNVDSRPKRYSSIRQQQQRSVPVTSANPSSTSTSSIPSAHQPSTFTSISQATAPSQQQQQQQQQQYISLNAEGTHAPNILPTAEVSAKNTYTYEQAPVNVAPAAAAEVGPPQHQGTPNNLLANNTGHHHPAHATHNYAPINGPSTGAAAAGAAAAYIPAATPLMAYYDPSTATGQASGGTATTLQTPLGLTQAYFTTDQAATAQTAPNYYLTTADLTAAAAAYHPVYHLQANYQQQLSSHHTHQSHVTNRYLNTTPANAPSAESSRYLQTAPSTQNSAPILVTGQAYQPTYPSGYPQFSATPQPATTPALGTAPSPLPAGFPNVPIANSTTAPPVANTQQQTPSGYPELYRGGITYYDIQSQQQAMQRQLHQNINQQQGRRSKGGHHGDGPDGVDGVDSGVDKGSKQHPSSKSEISVSN